MLFNEIKNDVAFIIDDRFIILTEHQSTLSPNFPLRMLCYLGKEYEKTSFSKDIFSTLLKKIPTPELYVFYEGVEDAPVEWELKLSDAFKEKCDTISVEVVVKVINVNYEKGAALLARCKTMQEYSLFMHMIRVKYADTGDINTAVRESIRECINSDVLREYLMDQRGDIMSVLEVNLTIEEREEIRWQDGYEEVALLTKDDFTDEAQYFERIAGNRIATTIKLLDRCNNVSGMATAFSKEKMAEYIRETEEFIYPLLGKAKSEYAEYSN